MELDQEKLTRNESERSRELAQRIRRELGPCSVQVLGGVGALESALEATGAVQPAEGALPELLVVVDPEWVTLPQQLADRVLLVCSEETMLAAFQIAKPPFGYVRNPLHLLGSGLLLKYGSNSFYTIHIISFDD